MIYSENNVMDVRYRKELGKWFNKYSIENFGCDWDYIVGLGYKLNIKSASYYRRKLKNLYEVLKNLDSTIEGIFVNEWDSSFDRLHHHLLIKSNLKEYDFKYMLMKYWKNLGMTDVKKYNPNMKFSSYMTKHINKTSNNSWDFLSNLK